MKDQTYFVSYLVKWKECLPSFGRTIFTDIPYISSSNADDVITDIEVRITKMLAGDNQRAMDLVLVQVLNFQRLIEE